MSGTKRSAEGAEETAGRVAAATGRTATTGTKEAMAATGTAITGSTMATISGAGAATAGGAADSDDVCVAGLAGGVKYWTGAPAPWSCS